MNSDFGNTLRIYRESSRMTQAELAEELDVTPETISAWENGKTDPNDDNLDRLVDVFGDQLGIEYLKSKTKVGKRCLSGISYKPKTPREVAYLQSMTVRKCEETAKILSEIMFNGAIDDDEVETVYKCVQTMEETANQLFMNKAYVKDMLADKVKDAECRKTKSYAQIK